MSRFIPLFLTFIFSSALFLNQSPVQAGWTRYSDQPVLSSGEENTWERSVGSPFVIYNGTFKMWYEGFIGTDKKIGYASSTDGVNWVRNPTYVLGGIDNINNRNAHNPKLIFKDNKYLLWYSSSDSTINNIHINFTTSQSETSWLNPIQEVMASVYPWEKDPQNKGVSFPFVKEINSKYEMWYSAYGVNNGETRWRIAHATSNSGLEWTRDPDNFILEARDEWEGNNLGNPNIITDSGLYHMFYHGDFGIGHAASTDGINWVRDSNNPILKPNEKFGKFDSVRVVDPFVLNINGTYYMYYTGEDQSGRWQIGLATSSDISFPIPTNTPTPTPSVTPTPTFTPTPAVAPTPTPSITVTLTPTPTVTVVPTLTPVSTPTKSPIFSPIIIVPGLGASWNPRAIFSCNLVSGGSWNMLPMLQVYKRLLNTLTKNAGLKYGNQVYIYTYDWRQPLDQQGEALKSYIDKILSKKPQGTRVRLIGHSLGGLVIRSYLANHPENYKAEKVLTLGAPHKGTVLAYPLWEKGEIWSDDTLMMIGLSNLINHCRIVRIKASSQIKRPQIKFRSAKEVVQLLVPSIKELLPTFDYLRQNGEAISYGKMIYQNDWLPKHPFPANFYNIPFQTLSGDGVSTIRFLDVISPTAEEKAAFDWLDGKPVSNEKISDGDGTILGLSSQVEGASNEIIHGSHQDLIFSTDGINSILKFLNLSDVQPAEEELTPELESKTILTISLDRTSDFKLIDPKGKSYESVDNLSINFNPSVGLYRITVKPKETGESYLHVTFINMKKETVSKSFTFNLSRNKQKEFFLTYTNIKNPLFKLIPL